MLLTLCPRKDFIFEICVLSESFVANFMMETVLLLNGSFFNISNVVLKLL